MNGQKKKKILYVCMKIGFWIFRQTQ